MGAATAAAAGAGDELAIDPHAHGVRNLDLRGDAWRTRPAWYSGLVRLLYRMLCSEPPTPASALSLLPAMPPSPGDPVTGSGICLTAAGRRRVHPLLVPLLA